MSVPIPCRPWPRLLLDPAAWWAQAAQPATELLALWADPREAHALLRDSVSGAIRPVSVATEAGVYPALSPARPAAACFERMIRDLWGHHAADGRDGRPWLDHGAWATHAPLAGRPVGGSGKPEPAEFLPSEGGGQLAVLGPVLAGFAEPGQVRLRLAGGRVARLEARLGFAHKGTLSLMQGKSPRAAARFAARLAGDATVAHSIAFARAAEAASGAEPPPRAVALRTTMAELERVAGHLSDCAAVAEAAGMAAAAAALARLREAVAGAAGIAFGHRLMMDCVIPGGVAADLAPAGADAIRAAARQVMAALPALRPAFAGQDRLAGLAVLRPEAAAALAVGGIVGRASGRDVDLRRDLAASAAAARAFPVSVRTDGDAAARVALRLAEIGHSAALLSEPAVGAADGPLVADLPPADGEGIGWAEGGRGDVWHWLRLEGGQIAAAFARDPGWLVWPALEEAAAGIAPCDLPLVAASFGASVSGMDL